MYGGYDRSSAQKETVCLIHATVLQGIVATVISFPTGFDVTACGRAFCPMSVVYVAAKDQCASRTSEVVIADLRTSFVIPGAICAFASAI